MEEVIQIDDEWYVLATSSRTDDRTRVLKHGETFGMFDRYGDIEHIGIGEQGLYHQGMRFLSRYEMSINQRRPMLLNSTIKQDNSAMVVDLTTPDLYLDNGSSITKGTLHLFRARILWNDVQYEHIRFKNFSDKKIDFSVEFKCAADFFDIFQVRGVKRAQRGEILPRKQDADSIVLGYRGLDGVERYSKVHFSDGFTALEEDEVQLSYQLQPHQQWDLYISVACQVGEDEPVLLDYGDAFNATTRAITVMNDSSAQLFSSNEQFNDWLNRSSADLNMLTTITAHGPYPYAGVPWFSTPFGRDGIITALQYLWLYPHMAKGVLALLAATQAQELDPVNDAEPGKILHESRLGEMAELGEIPFKRYYGTIDATPLFMVLAGAYYQRTGDRRFIESIWHNLQLALQWIDKYGDRDGDGFVEYHKECPNGLVQQGWKDSNDSIFHRDGSAAEGPIALSEVQGYVYQAKHVMADFYELFGEQGKAGRLRTEAEVLKERFNREFWCEDISTFAIALDGDKHPCAVQSSNAGHTLFSGIAKEAYALRVADTLMAEHSFSGWGIRTLSQNEQRYNPMSYHNGSIWPHDNSIIAMGLANYGLKDKTMQILTGMFDSSIHIDLNRLPELFCGFERLPGQGPTLYPVACSPQAWASGAVFYILQACLGLSFSVQKPQIRFHHPQLPDFIHRLQITNLRLGDGVIDLAFRRHPNDVGINVLRKEGDIEIVTIM